jgi:hypothetical protein
MPLGIDTVLVLHAYKHVNISPAAFYRHERSHVSTDECRSEVVRLRAQLAAEYEAAQRGLMGYAVMARHDFIQARMERMGKCHEELVKLLGPQEAIELVAETLKVQQPPAQQSAQAHNEQQPPAQSGEQTPKEPQP